MLREAGKLRIHSCFRSVVIGHGYQLVRTHYCLLRALSYLFSVMGVAVSSGKENRGFRRVPKPSFASFSTTGTLTTSSAPEEGEVVMDKQRTTAMCDHVKAMLARPIFPDKRVVFVCFCTIKLIQFFRQASYFEKK